MAKELYEKTLGSYEQEFAKHNKNQAIRPEISFSNLVAIPIHTAIDLVEKDLWFKAKEKFIVII